MAEFNPLDYPPRKRDMPPEIAQAIIEVMGKARQLGFDEANTHGGYKYASIDKFLAALRPLCAEAGLMVILDETECEYRAGPENRQGRSSSYACLGYQIWLVHKSGTSWGPLVRRLALPATGPQAFGAAESYVLKRFLRNTFMIPTGDRDADSEAPGNIPPRTQPGIQTARMRRIRQEWGNETVQTDSQPAHDSAAYEPDLEPVARIETHDPLDFGRRYIAALKAISNINELTDLAQINAAWLSRIGMEFPKIQKSISAAITTVTQRWADNMLAEDEVQDVLR